MIRDTLHQSKLIGICVLLLFACNRTINKEYAEDYVKLYQSANFDNYQHIYKIATDTFEVWVKDSLDIAGFGLLYPFRIDSAIIFNRDSTRLYTTINYDHSVFKDADADASNEFCGAKVNGKWYFIVGAGLHIPRNWYQDSLYAPMTLDEISYVAHVNFHQSYLIRKANNEFEGDDNKLNAYLLNPLSYNCTTCKTKSDIDSLFVAVCKNNRKAKINKRLHTKTLKEIQNSVRPPEPFQERSWWERIWQPYEPKIFGRKNENDPWK